MPLGLGKGMIAVRRQPRRAPPGRQCHRQHAREGHDPEQEAPAALHLRMVPWHFGMRGLCRDSALFLVATLVLGTAANLLPGRHLAWWGKGHQPPREGVDVSLLDPGSASALLTSLPHVAFLDTRSPAEYASGHVPGAREISYTDLDAELTPALLAELRAADAVIVYGASEETDVEQLLAQELRRRGLAPPYVLAGGFGAWQGSGLPVEGSGR